MANGPRVQFVVTGFGPFSGVDDNPTAALIELLEQQPKSPAYRILQTAVLEVAAEPVREWLHQLYRSGLGPADGAAPAAAAAAAAADATASDGATQAEEAPIVMLHLGVDTKGDHFKLEQQAVNDFTFRVPDQRGWQPKGQLIDDHPGCSLSTHLRTDLDVPELAERLAARRHDARPSEDAGRYVCNCTLYLSLLHSEKARRRSGRPLHALFLHVPPLAVVPLQRQFQCLLDLLAAIAQQLAPSTEEGEAAGERVAAAAEAEAAAAAAAEEVAGLHLANGTGQGGALAAAAPDMPVQQSALAAAAGAPAL
ncbi:pyroglutamyl-peptidase 1 [Chlorella sorokiniana]|uniref:Pyroglutamyl-peptidase 1 n=1 Tax=Chlorella sorokiniana TaxID=3076 RepID=A0A2P6TFH3_CHLSO|nr:pyroglutamyl-peptidase 1 [Chlorella sorokiniana]|eukprot:PRW32868.1 pyroglutamyl-peptidase 1 [Chlorella sorokiniana]